MGVMGKRWFSITSWTNLGKRLWRRFRPEPVPRRHPSPDQALVLQQTFRAALIAQRKGDLRLALLLAHQCDCLASEEELPGLQALLAELQPQARAAG